MPNILIIKLSALGDILHALPAIYHIRKKFADAKLAILTTKPFVGFFEKTGWFEAIFVDSRPKLWNVSGSLELIRILTQKWDYIIDLQGVTRTTLYGIGQRDKFIGTFLKGKNAYSGPPAHSIHPHERFRHQLKNIGIEFDANLFSLDFMAEPINKIAPPYVVLIPGASGAHGGKKRWPSSSYADLSHHFNQDGYNVVLVGGPEEDFSDIERINPKVINLQGKTNLFQLISVAKDASLAIGNDTGPTIMASYTTIPTLTLYSGVTKAYQGGANTAKSENLVADDLATLTVEKVYKTAHNLISRFT